MALTMLEKIISSHAGGKKVRPGDIVDVEIDCRTARDFGGANVVKNMINKKLKLNDPGKTFFTFDCNPTGSDQKYAANQHYCRLYARDNNIRVFDIDAGIGTHLMIDRGLVVPGATAISTDSHANILGAVGAFGQGMGDIDIAAAWHKGKVWFRVPPSVRIELTGVRPESLSAKDIVLNLLNHFGTNILLGYSIEIYGSAAENLSLDQRITISSMATEMGAIIILFPPADYIIDYCSKKSSQRIVRVHADSGAMYEKTYRFDISKFVPMVSLPGEPHNTVPVTEVEGVKIDSAFIGSCTNGRVEDMKTAAGILKGRKVAPGVVLKIVPTTDEIWKYCLKEGIMEIFKDAGALVSNAGCAGCAAGQVGQNGPGEITISTGNRNFKGKQGKGSVYLASPGIVAASAVAGYITTPEKIPEKPALFVSGLKKESDVADIESKIPMPARNTTIEGRIRIIRKDNIDTDMIFHNRYLSITDIAEMGRYAFDNLEGYEDFSKKAMPGDIIVTGKNFGCGSSRQQAVDCFISLGIQAVVAQSFGSIYERNAINAAFPVVVSDIIEKKEIMDGDTVVFELDTGKIINRRTGSVFSALPASGIQLEILRKGGLLA